MLVIPNSGGRGMEFRSSRSPSTGNGKQPHNLRLYHIHESSVPSGGAEAVAGKALRCDRTAQASYGKVRIR